MPLIGLLHGLQHRLVDPEADAGGEGSQGQVGPDADHAELGQGEEEQEHAAEHGPGLLHIPPVEQVNSWGRVEEQSRDKVRTHNLTDHDLLLADTQAKAPVAGD